MITIVCAVCGEGRGATCDSCAATLQPAPARHLPHGLLVVAAYRHEGAARTMVHRLKYGGPATIAELLAGAMAAVLPPSATALVPVPRAVVRRLRYGVDPARLLAEALGRRSGLAVVEALRPPLWWPRSAGSGRRSRHMPAFRVIRRPPEGAVLVDDVLTTGATLTAAGRALGSGLSGAVTATAAVYS